MSKFLDVEPPTDLGSVGDGETVWETQDELVIHEEEVSKNLVCLGTFGEEEKTAGCDLCQDIVHNIREGTVHGKRRLCQVRALRKSKRRCLLCETIWETCELPPWFYEEPECLDWFLSRRTYIEGSNYALLFSMDYESVPKICGILVAVAKSSSAGK
jgi:hypothetical protein